MSPAKGKKGGAIGKHTLMEERVEQRRNQLKFSQELR